MNILLIISILFLCGCHNRQEAAADGCQEACNLTSDKFSSHPDLKCMERCIKAVSTEEDSSCIYTSVNFNTGYTICNIDELTEGQRKGR